MFDGPSKSSGSEWRIPPRDNNGGRAHTQKNKKAKKPTCGWQKSGGDGETAAQASIGASVH